MNPELMNTDPCFNTTSLRNTGTGWAGRLYTAYEFQRFINWQTEAIKRADPKAIVSVGAWNPISTTDRMGLFDYYKDHCLLKAGGKQKGTLDFYQIHSYAWGGKYDAYTPFARPASAYGHSKPIVIGEFNQVTSGGMDTVEQFAHAYNKGYSGAWSWHARTEGANSDTWETQRRGIGSLRTKNDQSKGGKVAINLN